MPARDPESPLLDEPGAAGSHATTAFALLGNETRLAVLLALWADLDPRSEDDTVSFSRIRDRVGVDDPGNLRYHLSELEGQFVHRHANGGGYELRESGLTLVRAVIAGAGVQDATLEPTEIDQPCPLCDAPTAVEYRDGLVVHTCTECEGPTPGRTEADGFLSAVEFDPAGLEGRTADELRAASTVAALRQIGSLFDGLCPACSGAVDGSLECCADHDADGDCEACGTRFPAWARFQCRVCKNHSVSSPKGLAMFHPAVIGFYDAHGVSTRTRADDLESVTRVYRLMDDHELILEATDPPRATVTARYSGDEVSLTFDHGANVVDVRR